MFRAISILCSPIIWSTRAASILDFLVSLFYCYRTGMFSPELAEHSGAFRGFSAEKEVCLISLMLTSRCSLLTMILSAALKLRALTCLEGAGQLAQWLFLSMCKGKMILSPFTISFAGLHFTHILNTKLSFSGNRILYLSLVLCCNIRECYCKPGWFIGLFCPHFMPYIWRKMLTSYFHGRVTGSHGIPIQFYRRHIWNKTKYQSRSKWTLVSVTLGSKSETTLSLYS